MKGVSIVVFSPAKINLLLAVTGRRVDGFHDLVSLVAPVGLGDTLWLTEAAADGGAMTCDVAEVPVDETNLVLKAAKLFAEKTGWRGGVHFHLEKRTPMGAGLGGGSSNAVAALRGLNQLAGGRLGAAQLEELAAQLGSDCALFLHGEAVIMRGRGERVERLPEDVLTRLRGRRVLVFKPHFGISTPWAYQALARRGAEWYWPEHDVEAKLAAWRTSAGSRVEDILGNNMERAAFEKYLALPVMLERLRREFGLESRMSGSGSACFALLPENFDVKPVENALRQDWGDDVFVVSTVIL